MKRLIFLTLILGFLYGCQNKPLYKDTEPAMGTFVEVISPDKNAAPIVFEEFKRIENLTSKYIETSEISRLNKQGKLHASPDTFYIIQKAKEFAQGTEGTFDITVAPLIDLWGFTSQNYVVPTASQIKDTLKLIGSDKINLNIKDNVVEFRLSGMKIDLGAIAKGYALDSSVKKLKEKNISSCLINAGGQIYALGTRLGKPWKIAIQNPRSSGIFSGFLEIENKSLATSGDYRQYFTKEKKRYSHILNPNTGYPANSGIISVTVIADNATTADALSTAFFVMGKDKSMEIVKKFPGIALKIIEEKDVQNN